MEFLSAIAPALMSKLPAILVTTVLLIPFIVLEQVLPAGPRPRFRDYALNILISITTILIFILPIGAAAGAAGAALRERIGFAPLGFSFGDLEGVPYVGGALEVFAIVLATLVLHDLWFYWSHRLEHKVPLLWQFHKIHHSDERMNCATSSRDHFLQQTWRAFFPALTFGLLLELDVRDAAAAGLISALGPMLLSMFYHSGVRLHLPWLNRIIVTPQVHRIHHSTDPAHYNKNFADFLPVFDIMFGTYHAPKKDEFPATGLSDYPSPRNVFAAQIGPVMDALRLLAPKPRNAAKQSA